MSEDEATGPQQSIVAAQESTVQDVIQAMVTGTVIGDIHIGNIVYTRSAIEELRDYLERAVADYSLRMYQAVYDQTEVSQPYKFLDAFGIEDAPIFYGRNAAIEALARKVGSHRLTVLHARSGAGKTSLLQAGLSPQLFKQGRLPLYVRASENPIQAIKRAVNAFLHDPWPTLLADLALPIFLGMACRFLKGKTKELVILLDQFEQFFRFSLDAEQRQIFIRELAACYNDKTLPVRWLISLRKDYFSDLAEVERIAPSLQVFRNEYLLSAMTREEAQEAIIGPVAKLNTSVRYAPDLLETLTADLERNDMELPLLQLLCTQLYEQQTSSSQDMLTLEAYEALGRAEGVLRRYLSEVLAALPEQEAALAKTILKALVRSDGLKQHVSERALAAHTGVELEHLGSVLGHLVNARLLRPEGVEGERLYELTHEYLITEISTWIELADLEFKQVEELLQREMINWRVHHSPIPRNRLEVLYPQRGQFTRLDIETWACLIRSSFVADFEVEDWFEAVSESNKLALFKAITSLFIAPLKEEDGLVRRRTVEVLGQLKDVRAVESLIAALQDNDEEVRKQAAQVLGQLKDVRAVEPLITFLREKAWSWDEEARKQAVQALGELNDTRAVEPLIALLNKEGESETVKWSAADVLGKLKDARAVEPLIPWLREYKSEYGLKCMHAMDALGELNDARAVEPLIATLRVKDEQIWKRAIQTLRKINDVRAVEPLIAALGDENEKVRIGARAALGQLKDARAVESLIAALQDQNKDRREMAAGALGQFNDLRAVEPLIAALQDGNNYVREMAAGALGQLKDVRAVEPLIAALQDQNNKVREKAAEALRQIGTLEAVSALQSIRES